MMLSASKQGPRVLWPRFFNTEQVSAILEQASYKADHVRSTRYFRSHDGVCTVYSRRVATPRRLSSY